MEITISEVMGDVHSRLDQMIADLERDLGSAGKHAPTLLHELEQGLGHHLRFEEEVLFPSLRGSLSAPSLWSLDSLKVDHERIRSLLAEVRICLQTPDPEGARMSVQDLRIILDGHNRDEEYGIYREADRLFSDREKVTLLIGHLAPTEA